MNRRRHGRLLDSPLSFGLRSVLLIVLAAAFFFSWYVRTTQREFLAQQALRRSGGETRAVIVQHPLVPQWLTRLTGDETSISVSNVFFTSPEEFDDRDMKHIVRFEKLERLNLTGTQIGDQGLQHASQLGELRELRLDRTRISDAGLQYLRPLTNLRKLYMLHTNVTDEGVERLQQVLPACEILFCRPKTGDPG